MRATALVLSSVVAILFSACSAEPHSGTSEPSSAQATGSPNAPASAPTAPATPEPDIGSSAISQSCTPSPNGDQCILAINGEIVPGLERQAAEAASRASASGGKVSGLKISSNGGDLQEALKLGRLARTLEWLVVVPQDSNCYSSCVLILAGGVSRHPLGKVGIHRPYLANGAATTSDARDAYASIRKDVTDFLQDGGIRTTLWDDMLNVPAEQIRELSFPELEAYGLWGNDPSFEEKKARQQMQLYGIDRTELNRRIADGKRECGEKYPSDQVGRVVCAQNYLRNGHL